MPVGIGTSISQIGTCVSGGATLCPGATGACVNLASILGSNKYIKSNPIDPQGGSVATTGYSITKDVNNLFTVNACLGEGTTISVSR